MLNIVTMITNLGLRWNKKIWVSMDETTDVEGRYVVTVIIETLELESARKTCMLRTDILEKANT